MPNAGKDAEATLQAEKTDGLYLLSVRRATLGPTEYDKVVTSSHDEVEIRKVEINGNYLGFDERIELECSDFELNDGVLNVVMDS